MSDSFQLDMFGDLVNDNSNSNEPIPVNGGKADGSIHERTDDVDSVGAGVPQPLEEISSDILPESSEIGNSFRDNQTGGKQREGRDLQPGGERPASARSAGDSAPPLHSPTPGGESAPRTVLDYRLSDSDNIGAGGKVAKFEANISAIRLLKELEEENRSATAAEQSVLVKYTGWGGLSEALRPNTDLEQNSWTARNNLLKEYLSPKEYRQAAASTLNAHYTSPDIVSAVWKAVKRMGYTGGPTLEPAAGTGLFFGGRPDDLPVKMYGIELDSISGRIAKQLYPSADIQISGYENYKMPEKRFNLAISNVPFGNYRLYESRAAKTPGVDNGHLIHNYFFLKSLHGVKDGGLVAFITSKGTLDSESTGVRKKIARNADFIGAIRLPNSAFKQIADTDVVADIVFLQKRSPDVPMSDLTREFISTSPISLTNPQGTIEDFEINNYFLSHPEMVMGTQDLTSSQYGGNEYTVNLDRAELPYRLNDAVELLPQSIMKLKSIDNNTEKIDHALAAAFTDRDHFALPVGSFVIGSDLKVYQKESQDFDGGVFKLHPAYGSDGKDKANNDAIERIKGMTQIRDCTRLIFYNHYNKLDLQDTTTQKEVGNLLIKSLNDYYDTFTSKYGALNSPKNYKAFMEDPDSSLLVALEYKDKETGKYQKSDIFTGARCLKKNQTEAKKVLAYFIFVAS
ncbi:MAG: hypothetical protein LBB56_07710 [Chitinispirillales bacterium]|jgi:hypothetical protein|nr:hypothetical protein [Chitinispirillales bacterium]